MKNEINATNHTVINVFTVTVRPFRLSRIIRLDHSLTAVQDPTALTPGLATPPAKVRPGSLGSILSARARSSLTCALPVAPLPTSRVHRRRSRGRSPSCRSATRHDDAPTFRAVGSRRSPCTRTCHSAWRLLCATCRFVRVRRVRRRGK